MATKIMYDRQGKAVEVPEEQALQAYKSGDLTFAADDTLHLSRAGKVEQMGVGEALATLEGEQGRYYDQATSEQYQEQELAKEYGGLGKQAKALAAGAARGLTFGLSDVALSELGGDEARVELQQLQQRAQGASLAGEIGGGLVGALASGGSGLAARGLSAGARASAAVGGLAERAAARGALSLGLREGGAAARALATGAGWAAEGALQSVGAEASRAAVANEALDGEKLVAAGLHGALAGGALGAAGSAVASAGKVVANKALAAGLDTATALAERASGRAATVAQEGEALEAKIARLVDAVSPGGTRAFAAEKALKSTGGTQKQLGKIVDATDGVQAKAQRILSEDLQAVAGREPGAILSRPEMKEALPAVIKAEGKKIGDALKAVDAASGGIGPDLGAIVTRARDEVLAPLFENPFARKEYNALKTEIDLLRDMQGAPLSHEDLHKLSSRLGETIRGRAPGPEQDALKGLRKIFESEIEASAARVADRSGQSVASLYRDAKEGYAAAKMLEKAIGTGVERETANRSMGLTDSIMLASGLVQGGPVGAVTGLAQAYASNLARRYGDQAAAAMLRDVAAGVPVQQAVGRVVDQVVGSSVKGFFERSARTASKALEAGGTVARREATGQVAQQIDRAAEEREYDRTLERTLVSNAAPPASQAPADVAASQVAERGRQWLATKAPKAPGGGLQPHLSKLRPPPEQQRRFLAYARAVDDPLSVLADLRRGRLAPEGLEALRAVYPELYAQIRDEAAQQLAQQSRQLRGTEARQLGALLGVDDPDPAASRRLVGAVQAAYAAGPGGNAKGPATAPRKPVQTAHLYDLDSTADEAA